MASAKHRLAAGSAPRCSQNPVPWARANPDPPVVTEWSRWFQPSMCQWAPKNRAQERIDVSVPVRSRSETRLLANRPGAFSVNTPRPTRNRISRCERVGVGPGRRGEIRGGPGADGEQIGEAELGGDREGLGVDDPEAALDEHRPREGRSPGGVVRWRCGSRSSGAHHPRRRDPGCHDRVYFSRSTIIARPWPPADAHALEPEAGVAVLHAVEQRGHDAGAGHAERVAERDRAAVHVQLVPRDSELLGRRDHLGGERLVDLDEVDVVDRHVGPGERPAAGLDRAEAHDLGVDGRHRAGDDAGERGDARAPRPWCRSSRPRPPHRR